MTLSELHPLFKFQLLNIQDDNEYDDEHNICFVDFFQRADKIKCTKIFSVETMTK